jgi:Protein of unknown function (DUF3752)
MIGPSLPPHLQKQQNKSNSHEREQEEISQEPSTSKSPAVGPQLPPHLLAAHESQKKRKRDDDQESSETGPSYGPSLPSKRHTEAQSSPREDPYAVGVPAPESDSDDEIGPSLSSMMTPQESSEYTRQQAIERLSRTSPPPKQETPSTAKTVQRDSWMLAPPTNSDWKGSLDASKFKARTFNQSKSASSVNADHSIWTESPLERAQRLENEALGKKSHGSTKSNEKDEKKEAELEERDRKIRDYSAQTRGPSLLERHAAGRKDKQDEDDPSKRNFDYQKDIAAGVKGFKERSEMINKAKNLDSKYSGGKYL